MSDQPVIVKNFSWRDLCPWTIIFKSLSVAICIPVLMWATVGLVLTPMGWIVSETICVNQEMRDNNAHLAELAEINRSPYRSVFRATESGDGAFNLFGAKLSGPRVVYDQIVKPFRALFVPGWTGREFLYLFFGCLWSLVVWTFCGLAITRVAMLKLTRGEDITLDDSFDFSVEKFKDGIGAVGMPLLGVLGLCIPAAFIGLIMGFDFGVMLAGLFWIVILIIGLVIGLLLLGLMFGWPLMIASVSAEGQNSFDAMTRAYAYVFQKPLHYIFYCLIAIMFGGLCWLVVSNLTNRVVDLSYWATSWGANLTDGERIDIIKGVIDPSPAESTSSTTDSTTSRGIGLPSYANVPVSSFAPLTELPQEPAPAGVGGDQEQIGSTAVRTPAQTPAQEPAQPFTGTQTDTPPAGGTQMQVAPATGSEDLPEVANLELPDEDTVSSSLYAGRKIIGFWNGLLRTIAAAFIYGLFWCMSAAVYLLLRKDVDETEMDEIYMVDERRTYDLPPLKSDENGIPQVQNPVAVDDSPATDAGSDSSGDDNPDEA